MDELFKEKLRVFIIGALAGGIPGGYKLFSIAPIEANLTSLVSEYFIRFVGTIFIAFVTGFLSIFVKDLYEGLVQKKLKNWINNKNKKDEQRKKRDAA